MYARFHSKRKDGYCIISLLRLGSCVYRIMILMTMMMRIKVSFKMNIAPTFVKHWI